MAYPQQYSHPYGYYGQPGWAPPASAPPSGGDPQLQFGTFPGLGEVQGEAGFPTGNYGPPMYPVAPPHFAYQQQPQPQMMQPPMTNRPPSRSKNRGEDKKGRTESHRTSALQSDSKRSQSRGENGGHGPHGGQGGHAGHGSHAGHGAHGGAGQGFPPRMPAQAQHMAYPQYPMYPMYPFPPHVMPPQPSPDWSRGRYRLQLEQHQTMQPPTSNPVHLRHMHQDVEAQSPKSTTSTTSRSRKQLSIVHPKTGKQIEHEEIQAPQQVSGSNTPKHVLPQQMTHKEAHSEKMHHFGAQNGSGKESMRKHEEKPANRPKPITTSEVHVLSMNKQAPIEDLRKTESPRKKKGLQLQSPEQNPSLGKQNERRQKMSPSSEPEAKDVHGAPAEKEIHPSEGHTLVKSTVIQEYVAQTQLPQKKSLPQKLSPRISESRPESKDLIADVRSRPPESKIPTAPSKVAALVAQKIATSQPSVSDPGVERMKSDESVSEDKASSQGKITPEEEFMEEELIVDSHEEVEERECTLAQIETPPPVIESEQVESPDAPSSTDTGRAKSPETVIVNDEVDDSQDEDDKSVNEKQSSSEMPWVRPEDIKLVEECEAAWKENDSESSRRMEPPTRQDSTGRKASGSLKSTPSRTASLEKQPPGWRPQRENSRRGSRTKGDDTEVFHKSSGNRIYSKEFLLAMQDKFSEKPQGASDNSVWRDSLSSLKSRASTERPRWVTKTSFDDKERQGASRMGPAWKDPRNPLASRTASNRGPPRRDMEDKWTRLPSPFAGAGSGLSGLHQADKRYVVGELTSEDPQEESRQKKYKAILNKLTPENFDRMFEQMKQVEVREHKTLEGLIDQIFDKALTETTFCPLYANLCKKLMGSMPEFDVEGDKRKVTFRRLLLNKCQNEFEKGDAAMRAADAVEKSGLDNPEELEKLRVAKKERMRSLGNMQFIGHLFKEEMLTEKIIHQCIVDLLREQDNPKLEDIECLCQLVSTVGRQLKDCKEIGAYFGRIQRLTENPKLDTRHQFMLIDLIELRERNWVARRKAEGPKKIDEIRRDAQEEQMSKDPKRGGATWGSGLSSRNSRERGGGGWASRTPSLPQRPGPAHPNPPYERSVIEPLSRGSSLGRTDSADISLRPGSAMRPVLTTRATSQRSEGRGGESVGLDVPKAGNRVRAPSPGRAPITREKAPTKPIPEEPKMDPETLKRSVKSFLREFYVVNDMEEVKTCINDLSAGGASKEDIVATAIREALDLRGTPVEQRLVPLCELMCDLLKSECLRPNHLRKGVEDALATLPDLAEDFPKAPDLLADMMEDLSQREKIPMTTILKMIKGAGRDGIPAEQDTALVDSGYASKVFLRILKRHVESARNSLPGNIKKQLIDLDVASLYPTFERDSIKIDEVLSFLDGKTNS